MQTQGTTGALLIIATPPFALERARDVCVYTWTSIRPWRRRDRAVLRTSPRGFDQSRTAARPPPASVTYLVTLPFPAHAGPRVPPEFDQSRIALPKRSRDPDPNRVHPLISRPWPINLVHRKPPYTARRRHR